MNELRLRLHEQLCDILGSRFVYYQPPENIKMTYPAIVYSLSGIPSNWANNVAYNRRASFSITVIDYYPDSKIAEQMLYSLNVRFDRQYNVGNLYHYVFTLQV